MIKDLVERTKLDIDREYCDQDRDVLVKTECGINEYSKFEDLDDFSDKSANMYYFVLNIAVSYAINNTKDNSVTFGVQQSD